MAVCTAGHVNAGGVNFCTVCGLALVSAVDPASDSSMAAPALGASASAGVTGQSPPASSRKVWLIAVPIVLAVIVVGALLVNASRPPETKSVTVNFTVYNDTDCDLSLGYDDVPGSSVKIEADGVVVGMAELGMYGESSYAQCDFTAVVPSVPTTAKFYEVTVGTRGTVANTHDEMQANGWSFDLSLGND